MGLATTVRRLVLRGHDHHRLGYLPDALLLARVAQATRSYCLVPYGGRRTLGRDDASRVSSLSMVVEMELEWDISAPGTRQHITRRLGGGRHMGGGEDGMGKAAIRRSFVPPGVGAEENGIPQRLVVEGPYRYVRNPLYDTDLCLILGAALLTRSWALMLLAALYLAQLALQIPLEERELRERFGVTYRRYCELVPRFVPRRKPVRQRDLHT